MIILATALLLTRIDRETESSLDASILAPIQSAVESACERVLIVFPECEHSLGQGTPVYRSGYVPLNDSLKASLDYLYEAYQQGNASPEAAYWLVAGYVATGRTDAARDIALRARKRHPGDSMISTLDAIIAYFDGNYNRAETLLRKVLEANPNNSVASINLAVVLVEQSKGAEAKGILTRVIERHAGTPLAERARAILDDLQSQ
ncbi:MAG: tetratricopeptide repeat protein [Candidatus Latescibacteria bacterium]|nr:tetratricopeptide repeat protein [Candidatus Latescibacterota bacterium]